MGGAQRPCRLNAGTKQGWPVCSAVLDPAGPPELGNRQTFGRRRGTGLSSGDRRAPRVCMGGRCGTLGQKRRHSPAENACPAC